MSSTTCDADISFGGDFFADDFHNTNSIKFWHSRSARYGNTNDLALLIDGSNDDRQEYIRGLLASSITIFTIAVFWCILLLGFKCIGPYGVGWLSGRLVPVIAKPEPSEYDHGVNDEHFQKDTDAWQLKYNKARRTRNILKGVIVLSCLGIIASAIVLSVKGADSLLDTLDGVGRTVDTADGLLEDGIALIDSILITQNTTAVETEQVLDAMNGMCTQVRDKICTDIVNIDTCDFDGILENSTALRTFVAALSDTKVLIFEELVKSREDLVDLQGVAKDMGDIGDTFNWAFWASMVFSLLLALICIGFIYVAIWPLSNRGTRCLQKCFVIPIFVLMVVLSWVFSLVFVIGSIGLADMCYDSPDDNFRLLVTKLQSNFSPIVFRMILFYVSGCNSTMIPTELDQLLTYIAEIMVVVSDALTSVSEELNPDCVSATATDSSTTAGMAGRSVVAISEQMETLSNALCAITKLMVRLKDYFECNNWYPLYEESMYNALCYDGTDGFSWITWSQMAIVFLSILILTVRAGFYELENAMGIGSEICVIEERNNQSSSGKDDGPGPVVEEETLVKNGGVEMEKEQAKPQDTSTMEEAEDEGAEEGNGTNRSETIIQENMGLLGPDETRDGPEELIDDSVEQGQYGHGTSPGA